MADPKSHDQKWRSASWLFAAGLLAICFGIYLQNLGTPYITLWDEAIHVNVVQNLAEHCCIPLLHRSAAAASLPGASGVSGFETVAVLQRHVRLGTDFRDWTNDTVWLHKPLLPFYFAAATFNLAGRSLWGLRLSGAIFALLNAGIIYVIGRRVLSNTAALFAVAIFGLNPYTNNLVHGPEFAGFPDLALSCCVSISMYFIFQWTRYKLTATVRWLGLTCAIGYMCKGGLALGPFAVFVAITLFAGTYRDLLQLLQSIAIFVALVTPGELYWRIHQPGILGYSSHVQMLHLFQPIEGWSGPWTSFVAGYLPAILTLPLIPIAYFSVAWAVSSFKPNDPEFVLGIWILVYLVTLSLGVAKIENHIFAILPAFALLVPYSIESLIGMRRFDVVLALCMTSLGMVFLTRINWRFGHANRLSLIAAAATFLVFYLFLTRLKPTPKSLNVSVIVLTVVSVLILYVHRDIQDNVTVPSDASAQAVLKESGLAIGQFADKNGLILAHSNLHDLSYLYLMYWSRADVLDVCREPDPLAATSTLRNTSVLYLITGRYLPGEPLVKTQIGGLYRLENIPYQIWSKVAVADCMGT